MATIEITVGELHKELHEQLDGLEGSDEYSRKIRDEVENLIHREYQAVERRQEKRSNIIQKQRTSEEE